MFLTATGDPRIVQVSQKGIIITAVEYYYLLDFRTTHSKGWSSPMDFSLTLYLRIDVDCWAGLEMQLLAIRQKEKLS